jgi:hypothetical protein
MTAFHLLAQTTTTLDDGVNLPDDAASGVVWFAFIAVIVALYLLVSRTRRRVEEDYWRRKRDEDERRGRPPGDPGAS